MAQEPESDEQGLFYPVVIKLYLRGGAGLRSQ